MLGLASRTTTSMIGVDFGASSLRAVQLRQGDHGWQVHHWVNLEVDVTTPTPTPPHADGDLELAFGPGTFAGRRAVLGLGPPDLAYQRLDVPAAVLEQPPAQLRTALQIELDRQMPWPIGESQIAVWPVRPGATGKVPAMVAAARSSVLEQRLAALGEQGLECARADIIPNAMIRLEQASRGDEGADDDVAWGVLDLGFGSSRLYLVHGDRPVYARVLSSGGQVFTDALAKALHVSFAVAERYKRRYGIRATERAFRSLLGGLGGLTEDELPGVFYAILRPLIEGMVHEIERSYRFALGQLPGVHAGPMRVIGGGARLQGLLDVLSAQLGVAVAPPVPDGLIGVGPSPGGERGDGLVAPSNYPVLAPCLGLALMGESA